MAMKCFMYIQQFEQIKMKNSKNKKHFAVPWNKLIKNYKLYVSCSYQDSQRNFSLALLNISQIFSDFYFFNFMYTWRESLHKTSSSGISSCDEKW